MQIKDHHAGQENAAGAVRSKNSIAETLTRRGAGLLLVHPILLTDSNRRPFDRRNEQDYNIYKYDLCGSVRSLRESDVFYLVHDQRELGAISAVLHYRQAWNRHFFSDDGGLGLVFKNDKAVFAGSGGILHSDGQIAAFRGFLEGHGEICVAGIKNAYMHFGDAVKTSMDGLSALFSQLSLERVLRPLPEITLRLKYPENKTQPIGNTHSLLAPVGTALPESERLLINETWEVTRISAIAERLNMGVIFAYPLLPPVKQPADAGKYNFYQNTLLMLSVALQNRGFLICAKPALAEMQKLFPNMPALSTVARRLEISEIERRVSYGAVYGKLVLSDSTVSCEESRALLEFINRHDAIMVVGTASRAAQVAHELEKKLGGAVPRPIIVNSNFCMDDSALTIKKEKD